MKRPGGSFPGGRESRAGGRQPKGVQLHLWELQGGWPTIWGHFSPTGNQGRMLLLPGLGKALSA